MISCVRKGEVAVLMGYDYFPQDSGMVKIFEVWDTTFTTTDTVVNHYFRKEVYLGWDYDLLGRPLQRVEIYQSDSLTGTYQYRYLWTTYRDREHAERIEGTTRYVVLTFPIELGKKWDGNQYNSFDPQYYTYRFVDTVVTLGNGITFDQCVWVQQRGPEATLLSTTNTYEIYSKGVGMIFRYDQNWLWEFDQNGQQVLSTSSYFRREELVQFSSGK